MYTPSVAMPTYRLSDTPASILKTDPETPTVEDSRHATQDWCFLLRWKQLGLAQRVKDRSRPLSDASQCGIVKWYLFFQRDSEVSEGYSNYLILPF